MLPLWRNYLIIPLICKEGKHSHGALRYLHFVLSGLRYEYPVGDHYYSKERKMNRSIGHVVLNFAVAIYLLATGILGLTGRKFFPDGEIRRAVTSLFRGDFAELLIVILAILAIAAGAFILMKFFGIVIPLTEMLLLVLAIVWVVFIIMIDVVYPLNGKGTNFVDWLRSLGSHLMALGGILLTTERFGG